jgi:hypothetical protein
VFKQGVYCFFLQYQAAWKITTYKRAAEIRYRYDPKAFDKHYDLGFEELVKEVNGQTQAEEMNRRACTDFFNKYKELQQRQNIVDSMFGFLSCPTLVALRRIILKGDVVPPSTNQDTATVGQTQPTAAITKADPQVNFGLQANNKMVEMILKNEDKGDVVVDMLQKGLGFRGMPLYNYPEAAAAFEVVEALLWLEKKVKKLKSMKGPEHPRESQTWMPDYDADVLPTGVDCFVLQYDAALKITTYKRAAQKSNRYDPNAFDWHYDLGFQELVNTAKYMMNTEEVNSQACKVFVNMHEGRQKIVGERVMTSLTGLHIREKLRRLIGLRCPKLANLRFIIQNV